MSLLTGVTLQPHQQRLQDDAAAAASSGTPFKRLAWWSPGSGKGLGAISAAEQLSPGGYTAVVPASLRENYRKELAQFTDGKTPVDLVSYNQIGRGYVPKYPGTVVMDEVQRARNPDSVQAVRARDLAANAQNTIVLTGTPIINRFGDAASIVHMLSGQAVSPEAFEAKHQGTKTVRPGLLGWFRGEPSREEPTVLADQELRQLLDGKIDYHETAAKPDGYPDTITHEDHHVDLSPRQAALYAGMMGRIPWNLRWKLQSRYAMSGEELARARSFLTGPRQVGLSDLTFRPDGDALKAFQSSGKLQLAYKLMKQKLDSHPAAKTIAFSSFPRAGLDPLAAQLRAEGIPHGIFDGSLGDQERKDLVDRFNQGKIRVALLGPAASEGISLKGAQLFQQLDGHFNNARLVQAMARGIRYDSHTGLPPELRNMTIQRFYAHVPMGIRDRLMTRLGFDRSQRTETVDHYLHDLAGAKDTKTKPLVDFLRDVAAHNRTAKSAAERVHAGDAIRLARLLHLVDPVPVKVAKAASRFHRPENYDKIRDLPGGRELWAGANDWEAGWTWAWVVPTGGNKREDGPVEPEAFVNVDHSDCPGCKGMNEDSSSKANSLCVKFGKAAVEKWAAGLTKAAADLQSLPLQDRLRLAKLYSDMGTPAGYETKSFLLRGAIQQAPQEWFVDSDAGHTLGITHSPSGWRFHMLNRQVRDLVPLMTKSPATSQPVP